MMGYIIMSSCIIQYHIISYISHHIVKNMLAVHLLTYLLIPFRVPSSEFRVPKRKEKEKGKEKIIIIKGPEGGREELRIDCVRSETLSSIV